VTVKTEHAEVDFSQKYRGSKVDKSAETVVLWPSVCGVRATLYFGFCDGTRQLYMDLWPCALSTRQFKTDV